MAANMTAQEFEKTLGDFLAYFEVDSFVTHSDGTESAKERISRLNKEMKDKNIRYQKIDRILTTLTSLHNEKTATETEKEIVVQARILHGYVAALHVNKSMEEPGRDIIPLEKQEYIENIKKVMPTFLALLKKSEQEEAALRAVAQSVPVHANKKKKEPGEPHSSALSGEKRDAFINKQAELNLIISTEIDEKNLLWRPEIFPRLGHLADVAGQNDGKFRIGNLAEAKAYVQNSELSRELNHNIGMVRNKLIDSKIPLRQLFGKGEKGKEGSQKFISSITLFRVALDKLRKDGYRFSPEQEQLLGYIEEIFSIEKKTFGIISRGKEYQPCRATELKLGVVKPTKEEWDKAKKDETDAAMSYQVFYSPFPDANDSTGEGSAMTAEQREKGEKQIEILEQAIKQYKAEAPPKSGDKPKERGKEPAVDTEPKKPSSSIINVKVSSRKKASVPILEAAPMPEVNSSLLASASSPQIPGAESEKHTPPSPLTVLTVVSSDLPFPGANKGKHEEVYADRKENKEAEAKSEPEEPNEDPILALKAKAAALGRKIDAASDSGDIAAEEKAAKALRAVIKALEDVEAKTNLNSKEEKKKENRSDVTEASRQEEQHLEKERDDDEDSDTNAKEKSEKTDADIEGQHFFAGGKGNDGAEAKGDSEEYSNEGVLALGLGKKTHSAIDPKDAKGNEQGKEDKQAEEKKTEEKEKREKEEKREEEKAEGIDAHTVVDEEEGREEEYREEQRRVEEDQRRIEEERRAEERRAEEDRRREEDRRAEEDRRREEERPVEVEHHLEEGRNAEEDTESSATEYGDLDSEDETDVVTDDDDADDDVDVAGEDEHHLRVSPLPAAAAGATMAELEEAIAIARSVLVEAQGLNLNVADLQVVIEQAEVQAALPMGEDDARAAIIAELNQAMNALDEPVSQRRNEVIAAVNALNGSPAAASGLIGAATMALRNAGDDSRAILIAVQQQEETLRNLRAEIDRQRNAIQDNPRVVGRTAVARGEELDFAAARNAAVMGITNIQAAQQVLALCGLAAGTRQNAIAASEKVRIAVETNLVDALRVAMEQRAAIRNQLELVRLAQNDIVAPIPPALDELLTTAKEKAALTVRQLGVIDKIIELYGVIAAARQAIAATRAAIDAANDPAAIKQAAIAGQTELLRQAQWVSEAEKAVGDLAAAGLNAALFPMDGLSEALEGDIENASKNALAARLIRNGGIDTIDVVAYAERLDQECRDGLEFLKGAEPKDERAILVEIQEQKEKLEAEQDRIQAQLDILFGSSMPGFNALGRYGENALHILSAALQALEKQREATLETIAFLISSVEERTREGEQQIPTLSRLLKEARDSNAGNPKAVVGAIQTMGQAFQLQKEHLEGAVRDVPDLRAGDEALVEAPLFTRHNAAAAAAQTTLASMGDGQKIIDCSLAAAMAEEYVARVSEIIRLATDLGPQDVIGAITASNSDIEFGLNQQLERINTTQAAIPAGFPGYAEAIVAAGNARTAIVIAKQHVEAIKQQAQRDLLKVQRLEAAIQAGQDGIRDTRRIVSAAWDNPNKTPLERIKIIETQESLLKSQITGIDTALTGVNGVEGARVQGTRERGQEQLSALQAEIVNLGHATTDQQTAAVEYFKLRVEEFKEEMRQSENALIGSLQKGMALNRDLSLALIKGEPTENLRREIQKWQEDDSAIVQEGNTKIKNKAEALGGEINHAGPAISNELPVEQAFLQKAAAEMAARNEFNKIIGEMSGYQEQTLWARRVAEYCKAETNRLGQDPSLQTDPEKKKNLAYWVNAWQISIEQLRHCEQTLVRLEQERINSIGTVRGFLSRHDRDLYNDKDANSWSSRFNIKISNKDEWVRIDSSLNELQIANQAYYQDAADSLLYANRQHAVEPPVRLPASTPHFTNNDLWQNRRVKAVLEQARIAVNEFKENERIVRPLIGEMQAAKIKGDKKKETTATDKFWREHAARRQGLYGEAKAAMAALEEQLARGASSEWQAESIALKHEWSMADKEMRAVDMSNAIDLYAAKLQFNLEKVNKQLEELGKLDSNLPADENKIASIKTELARLSIEAQHHAQEMVTLQSVRKRLQEEIRLESEKVESYLGKTSNPEQKITAVKEHTAAATIAFTTEHMPDDEVSALVSKWNGLRFAYGQDVLATPADALSREGKTMAERTLWAKAELCHLLDFSPDLIVHHDRLYARYKEAMAILHPNLTAEDLARGKNVARVKDQINRSLKQDAEMSTLLAAGGKEQLDCWLAGQPLALKAKEPKKYAKWKEALQEWQIANIANSRFKSAFEVPLTVVGIEDNNTHAVSFFVAQAGYYGFDVEIYPASADSIKPGVIYIREDPRDSNACQCFMAIFSKDGSVSYQNAVVSIPYSANLSQDQKKAILAAIPQEYVRNEPLLHYIKKQIALLTRDDPAQRAKAVENIITALQSATADPRFALSTAASLVAEEIASAMRLATLTHAEHNCLEAAIKSISEKDGRVAAEDSSVIANIPFEKVRRWMIAERVLANPATKEEIEAARKVKEVYAKKGGLFTGSADLEAAQLLDKRGFQPTDVFTDGAHAYTITETVYGIQLKLMTQDDKGHPDAAVTIDIHKSATEKTEAKIFAKQPAAGPRAAAMVAKETTGPLSADNNSVVFELKVDGNSKKRAQREAAYVEEMLAKGIVPVFSRHESAHHDSAVWASFKDLMVAGNNRYIDGAIGSAYLERVLENPAWKKEFISGMFSKTGERGEEGQMHICVDDATVSAKKPLPGGSSRKTYTEARFMALDEAGQTQIIMEQVFKSPNTLQKDKNHIKEKNLGGSASGASRIPAGYPSRRP